MTSRIPRTLAALALLAATGLSACSTGQQFPPICPSLAMLSDAADMTVFNGKGQDITDLMLDARIASVPATCTRGDKGTVKTVLHVNVGVQRGPALPTRTVTVPLFIAVMDGDTVADRQGYTITGTFDANVDSMPMSTGDITLVFPVTPQKTAATYKVYIGFVLTPEQLALNRKRGLR